MTTAVAAADRDEQLALLRAHPISARARAMSDASVGEQAGAGLDRLTPDEFERLQRLNAAYRDKFGFPFLFAVKGSTTQQMSRRARRAAAADRGRGVRARRCARSTRIARFRLDDAVRRSSEVE